MPRSALQELGLTEQETAIYLALLSSGGLPASTIAQQVKLRRTTVYAILKQMAEKGFIAIYVRRGRRVFLAERPQRIAGFFEERLRSFTSTIPFLESLEKKQLQTIGLRVIETIDELKQFYLGVLKDYRGKGYAIMGNSNAWQGLDPTFFIQFRKDRAQANIRTRILLSADSKQTNPTDGRLLRETRFLPAKYTFKSTIDIFHDKVLIVSPDQTSLAIVIAVPAMVDIFQSTFDALWDTVNP